MTSITNVKINMKMGRCHMLTLIMKLCNKLESLSVLHWYTIDSLFFVST